MSKSEGINLDGKANKNARVVAITARGVQTSQDLAALLSAVMADISDGSINPGRANVLCNAAGKILKNAELEQRFGVSSNGTSRAVRYVELPPALKKQPLRIRG